MNRFSMRVMTVVLVLAVAGCGGEEAPAGPSLSDLQASVAALPKCSEVFQPGKPIDQAKAAGGCLDPDGGVIAVGNFRCGDGRHLWQVDASTGAPAGWGFSGSNYTAVKDAARDPKYSKAYNTCVG